MNSYEINRSTLAIIPENGSSRVYELDDEFLVDMSAKRIMEESCEYFGSTLDGRQKATTKLVGITHKVPVIVEESSNLIFFPTSSPRLEDCAWISLKHVDRYYKVGNNICVEFRNGKKLLLSLSYYVFDNQILRSSRLENVLRDRKILK